MLDSFFKLSENGTTVRTEIMAGATTFVTMAYIIFVNPDILSAAGMDQGAVFVATCLAAAIGTLIMGLLANYPFALAPGMGLNAYFAFGVVLGMGISWQVGLGAVFLSGIIFVLLSLFKIREYLINAIPLSLKMAIGAGIGLFLAIIGLKNAGIVVDHPATLVTLGDLSQPSALLACLGFVAMVAMEQRKIPGSILIAILGVTILSVIFGVSSTGGVISLPPSLAPTFMQMDIVGALEVGIITVVFAFLFVDFFDTAGTLVGCAQQGKMLDEKGKLPKLRGALLSDSIASMAGAALGTSTTTTYIESASGIRAGGRTGLTAVTCAVLFLLCLFFAPLAGTIPAFATAPALVFVACLMVKSLNLVDWDDLTEAAPAVLTAVSMPLTFSIATGIGIGFITYVVAKVLAGKINDLTIPVVGIAALFVVKFAIM